MRKYPSHFYEFGPFRLDVNERALARGNEKLSLTPKVFDTLLALIEARGSLVEKGELMEKVWPDSIVEEANLTQNISILRKTLGEESGPRQFIETVPKRGYRFIADVRETRIENDALIVEEHTRSRVLIPDEEPTGGEKKELTSGFGRFLPARVSAAIARITSPAPFIFQIRPLTAFGVIGFAGLSLTLAVVLLTPTTPRPASSFDPEFTWLFHLTDEDPVSLSHSHLSPDGKFIAYPKTTPDGLNIWITQVIGSEKRQITSGKHTDGSPIWSPDGQLIAFSSDRGRQYGIWTVPLLGGAPTPLITFDFDGGFNIGTLPRLKKWADDGAIYYEWGSNLYRLDRGANAVKKLTNFDPGKRSIKDFDLSPDETQAVYLDADGDQTDLWRIKLNDQQAAPVRLTNNKNEKFFPLWHPDGARIIFSGRKNGDRHIYALNVSDGSIAQVTRGDEQALAIDISAGEGKILCVAQRDESVLFSVKIDDGQEISLTDEIGANFWSGFSPDGSGFLFQSLRGERFHWDPRRSIISVRPIDNSQPTQFINDAFNAQWSPDGARIAFMRMVDGAARLGTIRSGGGEEKLLPVGAVSYAGFNNSPPYDRGQTRDFSWSPNSAQIAYCSYQNKITNVCAVTVDGGAVTHITSNQDKQTRHLCPLWSPGGKRIAYVAHRRPSSESPSESKKAVWELWVYTQGDHELIYQTHDVLRLMGWSSENELIVATIAPVITKITSPTQVEIFGIHPINRIKRRVGALENVYLSSLQLSQHGRNISFVKSQNGRDDIWIASAVSNKVNERKVTNNNVPAVRISSVAWAPDNKTLYYDRQLRRSLLKTIDNFR